MNCACPNVDMRVLAADAQRVEGISESFLRARQTTVPGRTIAPFGTMMIPFLM